MTKCYVCNRKASKLSNLSFHRFPNDEESKQKWLDIIGKSESISKRSTVCSLHFTEDCFRYGLVYGMRRLKEGSNPSIYLNETPDETEILNKLHTSSVSQTLDEVVNKFRIDEFKKSNSDDENSDVVQSPKLKAQTKRSLKRNEFNAPRTKISVNLTWDEIISGPDGGKKYWEHTQRELIAKKKRIKTLELTLRRMREKLLNVQTSIKELKENPYVAVYVENDK